MDYRVVRNLRVPPGGRILKDQIVVLSGTKWKKLPLFKGWRMRRVEAIVEVDGKDKVMVFLSNNLVWSAQSVCDLHRARWESEVFFKQVKQTLKQTLKLSGLVGYSANAIRWQVWTALLVDVRAEQLFFCKFFVSVRAGSGDGEKFLEFQREWVVLGRER
jgi:IS4 transposase